MKEPYFFMNHKGGETTVESANPRGGGGSNLFFHKVFFLNTIWKLDRERERTSLTPPWVRHYVCERYYCRLRQDVSYVEIT